MQRFVILLALFCFTALWCGGFFNGYIGHPYGDMPDHVWGNEWFAQSLRAGQWPWMVTDNLFPDGGVLWHIDPVGGLFRRLLLFLPPQWIWNLYAIGQLWLLGLIAYLWADDLKMTKMHSTFLAVLMIVNPYSAGLLHSGLSEYWGVWQALLLGWMLSRHAWLLAGACLALCGLQSFVMGLIGTLYVVVCAGGDFRDWRKWSALLVPMLITVLPFGWLCLQTLKHPEALFSPMQAPGWSFQQLPAVDLFGFVSIGNWVHPDTRLLNPGIIQVHSLGWGLISLAVYGAWRLWRRSEMSKTSWVMLSLSMGPRLSILKWMPLSGQVFLPLAILYVPFSPFKWVHHPYHMVAFVLPLIFPWVLEGMRQLPKWTLGLLLLIAYADRIQGPVPFPLVRTEYTEDVSLEGARLDFPPDLSTANRRYLIQQLSHREPIAYGINQWISPSVFQDLAVQRWIRLLDDPVRRSQNRDQPPLRLKWQPESDQHHQLDELGFEWLVIHRDFLSVTEWQRVHQQLQLELGTPVMTSDTQWVYSLQ